MYKHWILWSIVMFAFWIYSMFIPVVIYLFNLSVNFCFYFQNHLSECTYSFVPCPNGCSVVILRGQLSDHLLNSCVKRKIKCSLCQNDIIADKQKVSETLTRTLLHMLCNGISDWTLWQNLQHRYCLYHHKFKWRCWGQKLIKNSRLIKYNFYEICLVE